jgi:hypothetical protein
MEDNILGEIHKLIKKGLGKRLESYLEERWVETLEKDLYSLVEQQVLIGRKAELERNAHYIQARISDTPQIAGIDMDRTLLEERLAELDRQISKLTEGKK